MKFKIIPNESLKKINLFESTNHYFYDFQPNKNFEKIILATMHQSENFNNIEVLKFALWCQKNNIKLVMYGYMNQLPLFGIFADAVILQDAESWSKDLYNIDDKSGTAYNVDNNCFKVITNYQKMFSNGVFDLSRSINFDQQHSLFFKNIKDSDYKTWPILLSIAENEISNEEVVEKYADPIIYIRQSAKNKYDELVSNHIIKNNILMCEIKTGHFCGGDNLISCFKKSTKNCKDIRWHFDGDYDKSSFDIEICTDNKFKKELAAKCGQDYLSIQMLCSAFSNWMWACYGGSSNIFPFFPVKLLSISDAYCRYELTRELFKSRLGELGETFPETATLLYCLPGEKDGPSRTDGHPPLPNLQKLVKDILNLEIKSIYICDKKIL